MVALKDRYVPVGLGLLAWAGMRLSRYRRALALGMLGGVAVAGAVVLAFNPPPRVFQRFQGMEALWRILST